ncbi:melanoregulin [Pongo pygmaeus]|uniref:melanoregulin n=1 Tax=Pongo pygmaeus TaxID=9600 RepID=UPI0023E11BE8|nr:melanoregulin [Pongo pygmaeus]
MGLRDWLRTVCCCCRCECLEERALPEKEPLVSDNNPYSSFGTTLVRDDEKNLWSMPHDVSHTEADDDRTLCNLIVIRNQQAKDSEGVLQGGETSKLKHKANHCWELLRAPLSLEGARPLGTGPSWPPPPANRYSKEWQKLNYDIHTLRQIRREVRNRWKRILEDLGFQKEADSLLSVTKLSTISDSKNTRKAREMLLKLAEETNIFPTSWELSERYLFVVDRLIALDAAEEFFKLARRTYPKKPGVPCLADGQKELHYLPFPSP